MTAASQDAPSFSAGPVIAQTLLVLILMMGALLAPPASGSILLVPLGPGKSATMLQQALSHGARLEGRGLIPGSFVVHARRDSIAAAMWQVGALVVAANPLLCGKTGQAPR
ncbi:MAG: hypothetical protein J7494_00400 [Sphingobium sp.]|nr:hypothetical protein [Sphingobium sp.]